jgi:diguanylate cyclase (GGDEF)-like protein
MSTAEPATARPEETSGLDHLDRLRAQLSASVASLSLAERVRLGDLALGKIRQGLAVFDREQRLLLFNRRYAEMYSLRPDDLWIGMTLRDVIDLRYTAGTGPHMPKDAYAEWRDRIAVADRVVESVVELQNGTIHEIHHEPTEDGGWVATFDDITERRRFEARIHHMAHHDSLTGLANRVLFTERLDAMVARLQGSAGLGALLCLDLDGFKAVNDSLGHPAGDELLIAASSRIQARLGETSTFARLGGDEFAIILDDLGEPELVLELARDLCEDVARPFDLGEGRVSVGVSIGIVFTSAAGECLTSEWLLRSADRALYEAKRVEGSSYRVFAQGAHLAGAALAAG